MGSGKWEGKWGVESLLTQTVNAEQNNEWDDPVAVSVGHEGQMNDVVLFQIVLRVG